MEISAPCPSPELTDIGRPYYYYYYYFNKFNNFWLRLVCFIRVRRQGRTDGKGASWLGNWTMSHKKPARMHLEWSLPSPLRPYHHQPQGGRRDSRHKWTSDIYLAELLRKMQRRLLISSTTKIPWWIIFIHCRGEISSPTTKAIH